MTKAQQKNEETPTRAMPDLTESALRIDIKELLARFAAREAKRKEKRYIPRSDSARAKCVFVHSYIVGEHWRRRPNRS